MVLVVPQHVLWCCCSSSKYHTCDAVSAQGIPAVVFMVFQVTLVSNYAAPGTPNTKGTIYMVHHAGAFSAQGVTGAIVVLSTCGAVSALGAPVMVPVMHQPGQCL